MAEELPSEEFRLMRIEHRLIAIEYLITFLLTDRCMTFDDPAKAAQDFVEKAKKTAEDIMLGGLQSDRPVEKIMWTFDFAESLNEIAGRLPQEVQDRLSVAAENDLSDDPNGKVP